MRGFFTSLILSLTLAPLAHAEDMEDVIYKTDGSVLRGELIEQDFAAGKYKIRLMGGSVFSVSQDEISKITKEPFIVPITQKALKEDAPATVNVNVNQSGVTNSNTTSTAPVVAPSQPEPSVAAHYPMPVSSRDSSFPPHVLSFGHSSRTFSTENEYQEVYYSDYYGGYSYTTTYTEEMDLEFDGFSIAYQANFSNHFSAYVEYSKTSLDKVKISNGYGNSDSYSAEIDWDVTNLQALAIVSTNNGPGWQFYMGGGAFKEKHDIEFLPEEDVNGTSIMFGSTYAWDNIQAQLRVFLYDSGDYEDFVGIGDFTSSGVNLHLGLNL